MRTNCFYWAILLVCAGCGSVVAPSSLITLEADLASLGDATDLHLEHARDDVARAREALQARDKELAAYWSEAGLTELGIYQAKCDRDKRDDVIAAMELAYQSLQEERVALEQERDALIAAGARKEMETYVRNAMLRASDGAAEYEERLEKQRTKVQQKRRDNANQIQGYEKLARAMVLRRVAEEINVPGMRSSQTDNYLDGMDAEIQWMRKAVLKGNWDKMAERESAVWNLFLSVRSAAVDVAARLSLDDRMANVVAQLHASGIHAFYPRNALGVEVPLGGGRQAVETLLALSGFVSQMDGGRMLVITSGKALASRKAARIQSEQLRRQLEDNVTTLVPSQYIVLHNERILSSLAGMETCATALIVVK